MTDLPEVLTMQQAADLLQVSVRTVQRMVKSGDLPGRQVGRQWRFDRDQLKRWVQGDGLAALTAVAQRKLIEQERRRLGVDLPETLIDLQQAALERSGRD